MSWIAALLIGVIASVIAAGIIALAKRLPKIWDWCRYADLRRFWDPWRYHEWRHQYGGYSRSPWMRD